MKYKLFFLLIAFITLSIVLGIKLHSYYAPAEKLPIYKTMQYSDDTLRIAYIGDSWAFRHQFHQCKIKKIIECKLHCPVVVNSYGIGGLTSKEIYHALFKSDSFKHFIEKGYDYCFISAGINDTYKKMSTSYYKKSMDCIIEFLLVNQIHPIIQEIPDYNITKAYENQKTEKKILRQVSMLINRTDLDCKQKFRNTLNELIKEKEYQEKVSVVQFKTWNKSYKNDLKELYIEDQMHLNEKGYSVLDNVIANEIIKHILKITNN